MLRKVFMVSLTVWQKILKMLFVFSLAWQLLPYVRSATERSHSACRQRKTTERKKAWRCGSDYCLSLQIAGPRLARSAGQWTLSLKESILNQVIKRTCKEVEMFCLDRGVFGSQPCLEVIQTIEQAADLTTWTRAFQAVLCFDQGAVRFSAISINSGTYDDS